MNKIWQVTANFEDWESTWFITIGYFTDKLVAEKTRDKWDGIFDEVLKLLDEPEDWNPRQDEYYQHPYYIEGDQEWGLPGTYTLYWTDSKQYEELLEKYEFVRHLKGFQIDEFKLNEDVFLQISDFNGENKKPLKYLLTSLERDWKLKQLTE
jgi:hypothetical protein